MRASQSGETINVVKKVADMVLPSQDSTPTRSTSGSSTTEQDVIHQIQLEQLALIRVTPDESIDWQETPIRLGNWSNTLESEISRSLW